MKHKNFALIWLIWNNGKICVGEDWIISRHFLKAKNLKLGIIRVNGQLFYSTKDIFSNSWQTKGAIHDSGNKNLNRKAALAHYFLHFILPAQNGFYIRTL